MKSTKSQFVILCVIASWFFHSVSLVAEESYARFTVRTWTYRDGTQATGKMITVSGPTATLKLDGKGNVRVPLEKLSVKDLNWIYEYHKRKNKLSFLPPKYRKPQKDFSETNPEPPTEKPATEKPTTTEPQNNLPSKNLPSKNLPSKNLPDKKMTAAEPKTEESYQPFTVREWTFKDGSKYQAKFLHINVVLKKAVLIKLPAQSVQISLDQFSEKDLDWLAEYHRRNKMLALLPAEYQDRVTKSQTGLGSAGKPAANKMTPNQPKGIAERLAEQKTKAMRAEGKAKATAEDVPNVIKANTEIDPALVTALRGYRVWSDKKGQKSEAIFTRIDGREVMFATRTAGFVRVHIGTLIEEDLQLLRDALKMHGRFDEIPLVYREPLDPDLSPSKLKHLIKVNNHRKWTDLSGNTVGASYVKMEEGKVFLLITKTSFIQEFPYLNFIPEDQEYVQDRLRKEIPGNFFPAGVEATLTPEERENGFRIWTDRSQRQIKGKFVRLAYGESVAVINTGEKEELFITAFFSDQDFSLLKPQKKKQTNQLAMNNNNNSNVGGIPGMTQSPAMPSFSGMQQDRWEFSCPLCKKKHTSNFGLFVECPHCNYKSSDSLYTCKTCNRTFKADFQGLEAPCPHCNKNRPNHNQPNHHQVAFGNTSTGGSGINTNESSSSVRSGTSAYRSGRAIGKIFAWILLFIGFLAGANKIRG